MSKDANDQKATDPPASGLYRAYKSAEQEHARKHSLILKAQQERDGIKPTGPLVGGVPEHTAKTSSSDDVPSRLFEYEKTCPRSRRMLLLDAKRTPPTSHHRVCPVTHTLLSARPGSASGGPSGIKDSVPNSSQIDETATKPRRHSSVTPSSYTFQSSQKIIQLLNQRSSVGKPISNQKNTPIVGQAPPNLDRLGPAPGKLPPIMESSSKRPSLEQEIPLKSRRSSMTSERDLSRKASLQSSNQTLPVGNRDSTASTSCRRKGSTEDNETEEATNQAYLRELFRKAIDRLQDKDFRTAISVAGKGKGKRMSVPSVLDIAALNDLQGILNEARLDCSRKRSNDLTHSRNDLSRTQKRRISQLEDVLKHLNPVQEAEEFEPEQILACSYLRLTKQNIDTMEELMRQQGKAPGIHAHSDVDNYDVFSNLLNERTDLHPPEEKTSTDSTTGHNTKSKQEHANKNSKTNIKLSKNSMSKLKTLAKTSSDKVANRKKDAHT